jgi:TonB family protein
MRSNHLRLLIALVSVATQTSLLAEVVQIGPGYPVMFAPKPAKPFAARHVTGSGIFLVRVQIKSGRVNEVIVGRSTGDKRLDEAAVKALSRWLFKPGAVQHREITSVHLNRPLSPEESLVEVPVTFAP